MENASSSEHLSKGNQEVNQDPCVLREITASMDVYRTKERRKLHQAINQNC